MIFYSDEKAAIKTTGEIWVDVHGDIHTDEHLARYASMTHMKCKKCGETIPKHSYCGSCNRKAMVERYYKKPEISQEEAEKQPVFYSLALDAFFFFDYIEDFLESCKEDGINPKDARLIECEPCYATPIEYEETVELPEEYDGLSDVAPELAKKIDELNQWIIDTDIILSYTTGKRRFTFGGE